MDLKGKKLNVLGDSITEGHGTTDESKRFTTLLERDLKLACCRNYGIGGTRFARQRKPSAEPRWDLDFCARAEEMDPDADVVLVFGGTNDFGHGDAPFGAFEDRTEDTFCGACHVLINKLIERFPRSVIVFLTPLHRFNEGDPCGDGKSAPIAPLSEYVGMIRKTCEWYGLPVLDLYAMSGLQPRVPAIRERYVPDGLHPNDAGHVILADRIEGFLKSL